jgi:formylglycine-generating enzyme required for sulfatase activity
MEFVFIPAGTFTMGSPPDEPGRRSNEEQQRVTLTRPFYLQSTEVTVGQWRAFARDTGYQTDKVRVTLSAGLELDEWWDNPGFSQGEENPVTCVSWNDVQEFIRWLNRKEGKTYRLPTQAEWEYACRAGSTTAFANGDIKELECAYDSNLDAMGWYCGNAGNKTHPAAQKKPNAWGLYDMHGNVEEWCEDDRDCPNGDVLVSEMGKWRVTRGGHCMSKTVWCRSAHHSWFIQKGGWNRLGFRLARDF